MDKLSIQFALDAAQRSVQTPVREASDARRPPGEANPVIFLQLFWIVIVLQPVVIVVALLQVLYVRKLPPAHLARVAPQNALDLASRFLDGLEEGRFGYPSGFFLVTAKQKDPNAVVAREVVIWHSNVWDIIAFPWRVGRRIGGFAILIGGFILIVACFYLLPLLVGEYASKFLLRSRIRAKVTNLSNDDGSEVVFDTRGPCAHLLRKRLRTAFADPVLPARIAAAAGIPLVNAEAA